jgi:hypothetical protein
VRPFDAFVAPIRRAATAGVALVVVIGLVFWRRYWPRCDAGRT